MINPDESMEQKDEDKQEDEKKGKTIKVSPTYYSCTYFALMKSNKQKYKLQSKDQAEMFMHCCFLFSLQVLFLGVLYFFSGLKFTYIRDTEVNVALFFTIFMLHITCVPIA